MDENSDAGRAMLIFYKARLAFLAVPKTGTSAYHTALRAHADLVIANPPELKHAPLYRFNRFIRPMFSSVCQTDLDVLAVVREPVSWLHSWYRYRQRPALSGHANSTADLSFDAFVEAYLSASPPPFANVGRQSRFLDSGKNGAPATHLFRYEDQDALRHFLTERLKVPVAPARQNVSPPQPFHLSDHIEERLRADCAEDFRLYAALSAHLV